jgi:hypothetical protein
MRTTVCIATQWHDDGEQLVVDELMGPSLGELPYGRALDALAEWARHCGVLFERRRSHDFSVLDEDGEVQVLWGRGTRR